MLLRSDGFACCPCFAVSHLGAGDTLTGAGYQRYRTAAQLGAAGLNFALNLWLIPAYSWHGAAWASLATDGSLAAGNWILLGWLIRRENQSLPGAANRCGLTGSEISAERPAANPTL